MKDTVDMTIQQHLLLIASEMKRLFKGSNKQVMRQKDDGTYDILHNGGIDEYDLKRHLLGDISVSIYLLDDNDCCSTLCLDIDIPRKDLPDNIEDIKLKKQREYLQVADRIIKYVKQTYNLDNKMFLLEDTGGRGYHLWF